MPLTKANKTVLDMPGIQGEGADDLAAGNHEHNRIDANTDWYISPTGNDTTGDGSIGTPWATLDKVYTELTDMGIADGAILTINITDGTYSSATENILNHPDGDKIEIKGAATATIGITSLQSYTGSAGNWVIVLNLDADPNAYTSIGEYVIVRDITTSDYDGHLLKGCLEVTGLTVSTITLKSTTQDTTVPGGTYTGNVQFVPSQLEYTADTTGLSVSNRNVIKSIEDIIIYNTSGSSTNKGIKVNDATCTLSGEIGISGFDIGISSNNGKVAGQVNITSSSNVTNGIRVTNAGHMNCLIATTTANGNTGIDIIKSSNFTASTYTSSIGNEGNGVVSETSSVLLSTGSIAAHNSEWGYFSHKSASMSLIWAVAAYNTFSGIACTNASHIQCDNAISTYNTIHGFHASNSSNVLGESSQALSNTGDGYVSAVGSSMSIISANANNNWINYHATVGSTIYALSTTSTNPGSAGYSPVHGADGNTNSRIYNP